MVRRKLASKRLVISPHSPIFMLSRVWACLLLNRVGSQITIVTRCSIYSHKPSFSGKASTLWPVATEIASSSRSQWVWVFFFSTWLLASLSSTPDGGGQSIFISFSLSCVMTVAWQLNGRKRSVREERGKVWVEKGQSGQLKVKFSRKKKRGWSADYSPGGGIHQERRPSGGICSHSGNDKNCDRNILLI